MLINSFDLRKHRRSGSSLPVKAVSLEGVCIRQVEFFLQPAEKVTLKFTCAFAKMVVLKLKVYDLAAEEKLLKPLERFHKKKVLSGYRLVAIANNVLIVNTFFTKWQLE